MNKQQIIETASQFGFSFKEYRNDPVGSILYTTTNNNTLNYPVEIADPEYYQRFVENFDIDEYVFLNLSHRLRDEQGFQQIPRNKAIPDAVTLVADATEFLEQMKKLAEAVNQ